MAVPLLKRLGQVRWTLTYQRDLEADFVRWYGVMDIESLTFEKYLTLAFRVGHYGQGATTFAVERDKNTDSQGRPTRDSSGKPITYVSHEDMMRLATDIS